MTHADAARSVVALDEVVTLVREIERRFEPGDQIEQLRVDPAMWLVSVPSS